jgi:hypothetical protein
MTKVAANHLSRSAFVYIRQSTAGQLVHNPESRRRQYGLADRARQPAGARSRSSTMILAAREAASVGRVSSACWRRSVRGGSALYLRSRCHGWPAMVATGIR